MSKIKQFFRQSGLTKAQLISSVLCYFLCFALFLGIVVIWNPLSLSSTPTEDSQAADGPTNTGYWTDTGRYDISWYNNAAEGVGDSESNPYKISTAAQLAGLSYLVYNNAVESSDVTTVTTNYTYNYIFSGKYFKQTADIDLSAYYWQPIGIIYTREGKSRYNYFSGNYDGGNRTVSRIFTPAGSSNRYSFQGLFGNVKSSSSSKPVTIKNIGVNNSFIQGYQDVGGVVGSAGGLNITITNCYNTGDVTSTDYRVGGVVGCATNATITNCYNTGVVTSSATSLSDVGGVVGEATGSATITNCYNTGAVSGSGDSVGGVVGDATGSATITNCYNTGTVTSTATSSSYVGGVVGDASTYSVKITITNCYNTGDVTSTGYHVGGVVGYADLNTTITNCYNTGAVSGRSQVGGVVGDADISSSSSSSSSGTITITNCYNTGSVSGFQHVGGVVGDADTYASSPFRTITITNCYNTGSVESTGSYVGGVVGEASGATVTKCYYGVNCESSVGGINGVNTDGQAEHDPDLTIDTPKTELWYTDSSNWDDSCPWDFENVWTLDAERNGGYPSFIIDYWISDPSYYSIEWFNNPDTETYGDGSESNPYIIDSAEDLAGLSWLVYTRGQEGNPLVEGTDYTIDYSSYYCVFEGKHFLQTVNIDMSAHVWQPIGIHYTRDGTFRDNYFSGSYDGGNHTVSGIFTPAGSSDAYSFQGLFGRVYSSSSSYPVTIKNIGITNSFIQGNQWVGGVVGNAYADYSSSSSSAITITNCYNTGDVTSTGDRVGGVVGYAYSISSNITVTNCYNTGDVTGTGDRVGGVVGDAYASSSSRTITITNCYNTGNVTSTATGDSYVGGVVGDVNSNTTITNCYNTGDVTGTGDRVGGVVGYAYASSSSRTITITNCYNTGTVTSTATSSSYVGGVVGYADTSSSSSSSSSTITITNCYNTGSVSGSGNYVGGVVGYADTSSSSSSSTITITNCYNTGSVTSTTTSTFSYVGGVVGYAYNATITNCYNTGNVTSTATSYSYVGGVVGEATGSATITNCYNTGSVNGSSSVGGVAGDARSYTTITNCYNTGSVSGSSNVGGVVGYAYASSTTGCNISKSANFGDITVTGSSGSVGGIVGYVRVTNSSYSFKMTNCYSEGSIIVSGTGATVGGFVGNLYADYSTYSNVKIEFCSVDLDIVVSGGSIASQGAFYGGTNGLTVENSYSLLTKSGTVSKVISDVSTQMDNNFAYISNFKGGRPIPLGIFHILDFGTKTGIAGRVNAL